ncbi:TetR/AcrR family transcriptional regulator [Ponticaulis sp.]|uniref:TetR/AcrR family transcriptional regulator n=1 Tax=Ponticaulis sp. TaxID=2020902 RepID=UPI000B6BB8AB|nr:TetR/AcrR family transcriptional regulator [Ponticaulis sp.]MAI89325.1 TetR family transcriptional regulator [Ponticaulis sp.]OUY01305.1 MAG: TetR family transcriptional regulator [Hyphomonadaceae bacterium TMED5]|tara:strand:- start:54711 stop:55295 length:585 start_codon:yes stop_codon:yes gene_type:complete
MADRKTGSAERLLQAAKEELLANDGYMEMSAVAKRAGASVGLAYHHFGSKTGLIAAVVDQFYTPIREIALGSAIPLAMDWRERERARTAALIQYFYQEPLAPLIAGRLAREPEVLDIERAHMEAVLEAGARNIAQGQKLGILSPDLDPVITVAMLMGGLRQVIDAAIQSDPLPDPDRLCRQLWRLSDGALQLSD